MVCPDIADFKAFVSTVDGLTESGLDTWHGVITSIESIGLLVGQVLEEPSFNAMPYLCNSLFPRCLPESCELAIPCNYFENTWYTNFSYTARRRIVTEKLDIKRMIRMSEQLLSEISDPETKKSLN